MSYTEQDVERVAIAIYGRRRPSHGPVLESARMWSDEKWWDTLQERFKEPYRQDARAALEAMGREPVTAEQVEAYCKERGLVVMTKNIAEHLTRQAR